ncbi:G-type lectin S-receptor-like serine threonine-kinase LECRK3 [Olea europaea subsp. europaea]|uniref:non-specific serine/threonine protein kinase n=1 Tax=Olea europaea subsp. europaea TaxID=158383 RepID=A0A8S0QDP1_OLEEU|nr:G-type lectin S-receptor-like serine threonine-kinase LECRK3 [Olea europaea subsp. europaea]
MAASAQKQRYANISLEKIVVWTANRDDPIFPSNAILLLTDYGRLILQQEDRDDVTIVNPDQSVASASMLDSGEEIVSSASETNPARGIFSLAMQDDGNLVQYPGEISRTSYAYYASGTWNTGNNLQSVNVFLDSIMLIRTIGPQDVRGIFPRKVVKPIIIMSVMKSGHWMTQLGGLTKEDCAKACLEDCNCDAAFLQDGNCRKQRLPLRFGRRVRSNPIVALIKVNTTVQSTQGVSSDSGKEIQKVIRSDVLIISISLFALEALILAISRIYVHRNHVGRYKKISDVELIEGVGLRAFTYPELVEATNEFKEELGRGVSGTVYKGILSNNRSIVAVTRLDKESEKGEKEFETEMKVIGKTYHRNLVRLLGYCREGAKWLLVYEYMKNGSLADILFNQENRMCWEERIRIACDIARGILYLHEECKAQIIHCDMKPQNILMDEHRIRGTLGYVALEWHKKLPVTVKADVYSFGMVLLEIICGRKSVDWSLSEDEAILEQWVYNAFVDGEVCKLVGD